MICVKCNNVFKSARSLGNHKKTCWYNQDNNLQKLKSANKTRYSLSRQTYELNPRQCKYCQILLPFRQRKQLFCSQSCSASFNNARRVKPRLTQCGYCNITFTPHYYLKSKFCCLQCSVDFKVKTNIERDRISFEKGELKYREKLKFFVKERDGDMCSRCGNTQWMGRKITLWLDHIDGNASNNFSNNLRLICLNCDSQNNTFGGKNRGNGRRSRGLKPWE